MKNAGPDKVDESDSRARDDDVEALGAKFETQRYQVSLLDIYRTRFLWTFGMTCVSGGHQELLLGFYQDKNFFTSVCSGIG